MYTVSHNDSKTKRNSRLYIKTIRFTVLSLVMAIVFTLGFMVNSYAEAEAGNLTVSHHNQAPIAEENQKDAYIKYIVEPGDSLWRISNAQLEAGQDVQAYIYSVKELNKLSSSSLQVGEVLKLPVAR
jgi:LysM repeat protein